VCKFGCGDFSPGSIGSISVRGTSAERNLRRILHLWG